MNPQKVLVPFVNRSNNTFCTKINIIFYFVYYCLNVLRGRTTPHLFAFSNTLQHPQTTVHSPTYMVQLNRRKHTSIQMASTRLPPCQTNSAVVPSTAIHAIRCPLFLFLFLFSCPQICFFKINKKNQAHLFRRPLLFIARGSTGTFPAPAHVPSKSSNWQRCIVQQRWRWVLNYQELCP